MFSKKLYYLLLLILCLCIFHGVLELDYCINTHVKFDNFSQTISHKNVSTTNDNSQIYVDGVNGDDHNNGAINHPKKTLKSAVAIAKNFGTINVANGNYTGDGNRNILMNKTLNITGQDPRWVLFDGDGQQIIQVQAGSKIIIQKISFLGGNATQGGAINNLGNLILVNCEFKGNSAEFGGAIYNKNYLYINKCKFSNNNATQGSGLGGAIYTRQGKCEIIESGFAVNSANSDGGAINNNYEGTLILVKSKFQGNTARSAGAVSNGQNCAIKYCRFHQNIADRMGGAIYSLGEMNITGTLFNENTARFDVGGAIGTTNVNSETTINIDTSVFTKNHAKNYGAISSDSKLNINSSKFNENRADENGGAIGNTGNFNLENSDFINNTADKHAGSLFCLGYSNLVGNNFINNSAGESGGAVVLLNSNNIEGNFFTNNLAMEGGAIFNGFKGDNTYPSSKITGNNFHKSTAKAVGGAITNTGSVILSNNNFTYCTVTGIKTIQGFGGAIININGTIYLTGGNEFFFNVIADNITNSGGGIANFDGHIFVTGLGNVFKDSNILNNGYLEMNNCIIEKNTEDDHYLDNSNKKGYSEINCQIQKSSHYYDTINETHYLQAKNLFYPVNNYQFDYRLRIPGGALTYLEHLDPVTVHKGEIVHVKPQLWTDSYWPWDTRVDGAIIKFRLYNKNGLFVDEHRKTGWFGYADVNIDTSFLQPGDYRLSVSYDGEDPSNERIEHPIYRSCLNNVAFTVVE